MRSVPAPGAAADESAAFPASAGPPSPKYLRRLKAVWRLRAEAPSALVAEEATPAESVRRTSAQADRR